MVSDPRQGLGTLLLIAGIVIFLASLSIFGFVPLAECPQCYGSGEWGGVRGDPDSCSHCDGKGDISLFKRCFRRPEKPPQRVYPFLLRLRWYQLW
jgi:hypothetical protein